jgi:thiol-disulfide isomerase/thioredoxin
MKTKIIIFLLTGICLSLSAQQTRLSYTIKGDIAGWKGAMLYLFFAGGAVDSLAISGGKFSYTGSVSEPQMIYLSDGTSFTKGFYVEGAPVDIRGASSSVKELSITGGKTQQEFNALNASTRLHETQRAKLLADSAAAQLAGDKLALADIKTRLEKLGSTDQQVLKPFILSHPKSFVSLDKIRTMGYNATFEQVSGFYKDIDPELKKSQAAKKLEESLLVLKKGGNGQKMIDFTQADISGKPVRFSSFKGKYVLVDFWASWCGPCRAENPNVLQVYQTYSAKGFTVIGVSLDDSKAKWEKAVKDDKLPWSQVSDLKGWKNEVSTYYGIHSIPSNYLVDPSGIIIARNLRGAELEKKLAELIK